MNARPMQLADRARVYVDAIPSAIAGQHGHAQTFSVACALIHGFGLTDSDAWPIFADYCSRCSPPWSPAEMRHKLAEAAKANSHTKPRGHLLNSGAASHRRTVQWRVACPRPPSAHRSNGKVRVIALGQPQIAAPPPSKPEALAENAKAPEPPTLPDEAPEPTDAEAGRIAGELVKMHKDGAIAGPDDTDTVMLAGALKVFGATYESFTQNREDRP